MVFISPLTNGVFDLDKGLFMSTHMAANLSEITFSERLYPVHLPFEGLIRLNFGEDDGNTVDRKTWMECGLPPLYDGGDLTDKKLVVFPMHALGDQLYLAIVLRALAEKYPGLHISIVRSGIPSVEKWYPYIYFEPFVSLTDPVLSSGEMKRFDAFVDAEHFAHKESFRGRYAADFFASSLFFHDPGILTSKTPRIAPLSKNRSTNGEIIDQTLEKLRNFRKPVVFVNLLSTGRSRDLPVAAVLEFAERVKDRCSLIFSSYNNKGFEMTVKDMACDSMICSGGLEKDVSDLVAIISRSDMVITTDSGIAHLAEALEKPCGTVFNVALPEERTAYYRFSESLRVDFEIPGVCKTPCYVFALDEGEYCRGMVFANSNAAGTEQENPLFYAYPPCMENLRGDHLCQLFDALIDHFF